MTVEAVAIHHLDNLDAKVNAFARAIKEDANAQSKWTNYDPKLERKLYKGDLGRSAAPAKPKPAPTSDSKPI
jgi:3'-5' exoribonuclease